MAWLSPGVSAGSGRPHAASPPGHGLLSAARRLGSEGGLAGGSWGAPVTPASEAPDHYGWRNN